MAKSRLLYSIQSTHIKLRVYRLMRQVVAWFLFAAIANLLFSYIFHTPKSYYINNSNIDLYDKISNLERQMEDLDSKVSLLDFRYKSVYKPLFGMETVMPYEQSNKLGNGVIDTLHNDRFVEYLSTVNRKKMMLGGELIMLSHAMDTVANLVKNKNMILASLPTLCPIDNKDINYISDKFGWRFHPVLHRNIFHEGLDLSCAKNSPVYAAADGVVKKVKREAAYGKYIEIDHGFGYKTKYAHLNDYKKEVGDIVRRGEVIALSGNTGRTTGPHLHYEVIFNNKPVDPLYYLSRDMSDEDFNRIVETAKEGGDNRYTLLDN